MEEKLNIVQEEHTEYTLLKIEGRIDGYWSKQLEEYLDNALRAGKYNIALDLTGVNYLSSLGIRILVKFKKLYRQVNGGFGIVDASKSVIDLLGMAGLHAMLKWQVQEVAPAIESASRIIESDGYVFKVTQTAGLKDMECYLNGNPEKLTTGGFGKNDCKSLKFGRNHYGIGLGAIGLDFDDCKNRFGEFVALGDSVVYSPAGKPNNPDYMLKSGALIPGIELLYGITFEGDFDTVINFSSSDFGKTIGLSTLLTKIFEITAYENLVMVMLAETSGLVGLSINHSPAAEGENIQNPFTYPEIKENVNFTTEPEFQQLMTITAGVASVSKDGSLEKFTRPFVSGSPILQHFHTAVFSYHPLKKTDINLDDTISALFEQDKIRGVLHLVNDTREITGIGESEFTGGVCWIGNIKSPIKTR